MSSAVLEGSVNELMFRREQRSYQRIGNLFSRKKKSRKAPKGQQKHARLKANCQIILELWNRNNFEPSS